MNPETHWFDRLPDSKSHYGTKKKPQDSEKDYDLINLLDDLNISTSLQSGRDKENKIDDLQIQQLQLFLSSTGASRLETKHQEEEFQKFLDKYERNEHKKDFYVVNTDVPVAKKSTDSNLYMSHNYIETPKALFPKLDELHLKKTVPHSLYEAVPKEKFENYKSLDNVNSHNLFVNLNSSKNKYNTPSCNSSLMDEVIVKNNIDYTSPKIANGVKLLKNELHKNQSEINIEELITKYNCKYLEAVRMDEKKFNKRSLLRSESEKLSLTPGPTLLYKSEVLPQIIKRLNDRTKTLSEEIYVKKKLVLDSGSPNDNLAEVTGLAECAKSDNHKQNSHFQNLTQTNYNHATTLHPSFSLPDYPKANINNQIETSSACKFNEFRTKKDVTYSESRFIHIDELKALKKERIDKEDCVKVGMHVLRAPEILMSDCNKARFVDNATSQLFNDFIFGKK